MGSSCRALGEFAKNSQRGTPAGRRGRRGEVPRRERLRTLRFEGLEMRALLSASLLGTTAPAAGGVAHRAATAPAVQSTPTVASISPSSGTVFGGTQVTIVGTGFNTGKDNVMFGLLIGNIISETSTSIVATSPEALVTTSDSTVDIAVNTVYGISAPSSADQFTYLAPVAYPPVISTSGSDPLFIGNLPAGISVTENFYVNNTFEASQYDMTSGAGALSFTSPVFPAPGQPNAHIDGDVMTVEVDSAYGKLCSLDIKLSSYVPVIDSLSQDYGPTGFDVTIMGHNLGAVLASQSSTGVTTKLPCTATVDFGPDKAKIVNSSPDGDFLVVAVPPPNGSTGAYASYVPIKVTNTWVQTTGSAGSRTTTYYSATSYIFGSTCEFAYVPTVSSISPASGPTSGGAMVTIVGTGFTPDCNAYFGGAQGTTTFVSDSKITAIAPAGTGTVDVVVKNACIKGVSPTTPSDQFTYETTIPSVSGISPASGPAGTNVTITGTDLGAATAVYFGKTKASSFTVSSDTKIMAVAPSGTGTVDVTVVTPAGTTAISTSDEFTYNTGAPYVSGISPASGPAGTSVTITGMNLSGAMKVLFGTATAASFALVSNKKIMAIAPSGAGTVDVTVVTPDGASAISTSDQFTYKAVTPVVTGLSPTSGPAAGGTQVTITGKNLDRATAVYFGKTNAASFTVTGKKIIAVAPPGTGTVDVTVVTSGGTSAVSTSDQFTYKAGTPIVTGLSPTSGPAAGGTTVTITGSGFAAGATVKFGSKAAKNVTVVSAVQITAVAPAGTGTVDVTVKTAIGTSATSSADQFTYTGAAAVKLPPPVVASSSQRRSPAANDAALLLMLEEGH